MFNFHTLKGRVYGIQSKKDDNVSIKEWLITMLIVYISIVNIVMIFVWHMGPIPKQARLIILKLH